jgi:hypothetical protein
MTVGVLTLELGIFDARSLKDKRRALRSVKDRLRNGFSVSVAEVDELDSWQRAVLGVAMVGNEARFVNSCLDKIVDWIRKQRSVTLIDYSTEMR